MTPYYFSKTLALPFGEAEAHVTEALSAEGFGVLTEIDVQATLKKKLDVDFRPYKILGACNPGMAHQALQAEPHIGTMLPCNVVLQDASRTTPAAASRWTASNVAYWTVWVEPEGAVHFRADLYGRDRALAAALAQR